MLAVVDSLDLVDPYASHLCDEDLQPVKAIDIKISIKGIFFISLNLMVILQIKKTQHQILKTNELYR